jgi:geranylgeranyl diphosphate synthase type II
VSLDLAGLQEKMARLKKSVDKLILEDLLPSSSPIREVDLLYKMMRDYPQRPAKGLRPFLCVTSCMAFGGKRNQAILTAACIELFQNWILIHDDIEDASSLRRGEPVLHVKYDESLAINAGDALHARMWGYLLRNRAVIGTDRAFQILEEFSQMVDQTTEGQHMELSWVVHKRWDLGEKDYIAMVTRKTGWYTVTSPCRMGAIIAGATPTQLRKLSEFGTKLGVGFQIQDDVLNLTAEGTRYGKEPFDDILEGKRTLMLLRLLKVAGPDERDKLVRIMEKKREEKTPNDVNYVLSLMEKYGTIEYAREKARRLASEAMSAFRALDFKGDAGSIKLFKQAAEFLVERKW